MNAELEGYLDQVVSIKQDAPGICANLSDAQFNWRPGPNRWSIAGCFDHLITAARLFMPTFDQAIANARGRGLTATGPFTYPLLERLFLMAMEPHPKLRFRAPAAFAPAPHGTAAALTSEFVEWQDRLAERILQADGLDLRRARQQSAAARWLTYCLGTGFAVMLAHERRHLRQARQVRTDRAFPTS